MPRDIDPPGERVVITQPARDSAEAGCRSIRGVDAPPARWACVYTQPQAERWADQNLRRIGYQTYLPMLAVRRRDPVTPTMHHDVLVPLFSRYLFVQFDHTTESWSPIRACPGVVDLVRSGSQIQYARADVLSVLQAGEAVRRTSTPPEGVWRPGAACRLAGGPCHGLDAVVVAVGRRKALVAVMMLGALREVMVQLTALEARGVD